MRLIIILCLFTFCASAIAQKWQFSGAGSSTQVTVAEGDTVALDLTGPIVPKLYGPGDSLLRGPKLNWFHPDNINDGYSLRLGFTAKRTDGYKQGEARFYLSGEIMTPIQGTYRASKKWSANTLQLELFAGAALLNGAQIVAIGVEGSVEIKSADVLVKKDIEARDSIYTIETANTNILQYEDLVIANELGTADAVFEIVGIEHPTGVVMATVRSITASLITVRLFRVDAVGWTAPAVMNYRIRRP